MRQPSSAGEWWSREDDLMSVYRLTFAVLTTTALAGSTLTSAGGAGAGNQANPTIHGSARKVTLSRNRYRSS